jgi:outer membrane protein OmpA-like peptidoglycan-associated protein
MNAIRSYAGRMLLGAALLHAPSLGGQTLALASALLPGDGGGAPAPAASLVDDGAQALLEQVRALTAPGRDLTDDPAELPCDRQPQSPELAVAQQRPEAIVTRVFWEIRARRTIDALQAPLPVCFAAGRAEPDRVFQNVVRFNSDWLSAPGRGQLRFVLSGYAAPDESTERQPPLGQQRASWVRQGSGANVQRRLTVQNGGVSPEVGRARWVEYTLSGR